MDRQLAKYICQKWMSNMKHTLELEEFSYREKGRDDPKYKTFKKHLMANTYDSIRQVLAFIEELGLIQKTDYPEDIKDGYKDSASGGSGYVNTEDLDAFIDGE